MTKTEKNTPEGSLAATEKMQKGSLPETADGAYAHFLAEAMALPEDEISPYRIDAALAVYNARTGIAAVSKQLDALRAYNLPVNGIVDFSALLLAFGHAVARCGTCAIDAQLPCAAHLFDGALGQLREFLFQLMSL